MSKGYSDAFPAQSQNSANLSGRAARYASPYSETGGIDLSAIIIEMHRMATTPVLVAIPLFIMMAQLLDRSKVADELFETLYVVLGGLKGGLGLAVVVVCTVFAATTGIIGASVVAMGLLATSALMKKDYQKEMSAGIICAAGTLGILIPPSIMMVVYGGLTGMK